MKDGWYTFVSWGSDPTPARGPFRSIEDADAAMDRFILRHGYKAGTWLKSGNVAMAGPYPTRLKALAADISHNNRPTPQREVPYEWPRFGLYSRL
jgi:hypothetical protein